MPAACAKCHSEGGYLDFLGLDGSAAGKVDANAKIGTVVSCTVCHNAATVKMTSVVFPSGVEVTDLGPEARCMQCHQGRAFKGSVDAAIEKAKLTDPDTPSPDLGFTNIHYFAAAATQFGTVTMGGYEYDGKAYDAKFDHVEGYDTCVDCHNPHTLEVRVEECTTCHTGVKTVEDLKNVRMAGSAVDYDGDGDTKEGIAGEIEGLQGMLLQAIQAYAKDVAGAPIAYNAAAYPYFFADTNGNGVVDTDEAQATNAYKSWTARLAKAAYNYQTSVKDPGTFAHGGKYIIQLLYDSIEDLNAKLATPVDLSKAHRIDAGHFAGSEEAFRHWDDTGVVPGACARCHSGTGLPLYLKEGVNISTAPSNGFLCSTCHDAQPAFTRYKVETVTFPSGAKLAFKDSPDSNLCLACHQGRESTVSVNAAIKGLDLDKVSDKLRFRNVHYFAAGATLFGTDAKGAYEYDGKTYVGQNAHVPGFDTCASCHDGHALDVKVEACGTCHATVKTAADLETIRIAAKDYDGDGDTKEGVAGEVEGLREELYAALQAYAKDVAGAPIAYNAAAYPYFFADTNGNGVVDTDEAQATNAYKSWTPRLLQAAYNYQYATKDPGAFAHNPKYIAQVLYDSIASLGAKVKVDMTGMVRP
ncbi:MAG: hypothetical protein H5T65_12075 [Chloroflexi bacterium]|nr:hypothetical protein [Chloroflexota bacterium]